MNGVQILDWARTPHSRSFWFLVVVLVLMGAYGWGAARYETRIRKALSEADVLGIALQELVGPMIEAAKKDIKEGKLRTLEDVKQMFGQGQEADSHEHRIHGARCGASASERWQPERPGPNSGNP